MAEAIGLVTARGGSKGVPRKSVRPVGGKPLIAWTIEAALASRALDRVLLSTDDDEIAEVGRRYGADVRFMRPRELAEDDTPHIDVVLHAIRWLEDREGRAPDSVMLLQPTSPLRTAEDVSAAVALAKERRADAVVSVTEMAKHPYLAKRVLEDGTLEDFMPPPSIEYMRRQALPRVYAPNGAIYLNRSEALLRDRAFCPKGAVAYVMPPERSLDVDTLFDLRLVDFLLREQHADQR